MKHKLTLIMAVILPLTALLLSPSVVGAQSFKDEIKGGAGIEQGADNNTDVNGLLTTTVDIISVLVGIIAVLVIIFGGFRYITSGGDSSKINTAKNTILYAIIGLVIVALAQIIVKYVIHRI